MKILLLSVGKPKDPVLVGLHDAYAARVRRLGVGFEARHVPEVRAGSKFSDDHVKERESAALLAAIERDDALVALDPGGEPLTSEALARRIERLGGRRIVFAIGGPLGHHPTLLGRAQAVVAFSRLTFPHEWVRPLVAEQIYRAVTRIRGVPYHK